jgi:hypothetical protein
MRQSQFSRALQPDDDTLVDVFCSAPRIVCSAILLGISGAIGIPSVLTWGDRLRGLVYRILRRP